MSNEATQLRELLLDLVPPLDEEVADADWQRVLTALSDEERLFDHREVAPTPSPPERRGRDRSSLGTTAGAGSVSFDEGVARPRTRPLLVAAVTVVALGVASLAVVRQGDGMDDDRVVTGVPSTSAHSSGATSLTPEEAAAIPYSVTITCDANGNASVSTPQVRTGAGGVRVDIDDRAGQVGTLRAERLDGTSESVAGVTERDGTAESLPGETVVGWRPGRVRVFCGTTDALGVSGAELTIVDPDSNWLNESNGSIGDSSCFDRPPDSGPVNESYSVDDVTPNELLRRRFGPEVVYNITGWRFPGYGTVLVTVDGRTVAVANLRPLAAWNSTVPTAFTMDVDIYCESERAPAATVGTVRVARQE